MISIIDYGVGNLGSLLNIHKRLGLEVQIANTPELVDQSTHLILPGVGSFDRGMKKLEESGLSSAIVKAVSVNKIPILGICLGMHMMTDGSEEGTLSGLGWIEGKARRFDLPAQMKIPHIGWNTVRVEKDNSLFDRDSQLRYYFVHSYFIDCCDKQDVIGITNYEIDFVCAYQRNNIYGVQFHPEKSHNYGKTLLKNFANI